MHAICYILGKLNQYIQTMDTNSHTTDNNLVPLHQEISESNSFIDVSKWLEDHALPYMSLMAYYKCAIMEVETKFKVLNENFSLGDDCNPIESIKTRLKSPKSIMEKMIRRGYPLTVESIEQNLFDIAGVRVICSFTSDIYKLADALLKQDDVFLLQKKDYIQNPKPNGYRSLHLIISTPIFLQSEKRMMKVEVQLRTIAMDAWASLEHKIRYKKSNDRLSDEDCRQLGICAGLCSQLDAKMEEINTHCGR